MDESEIARRTLERAHDDFKRGDMRASQRALEGFAIMNTAKCIAIELARVQVHCLRPSADELLTPKGCNVRVMEGEVVIGYVDLPGCRLRERRVYGGDLDRVCDEILMVEMMCCPVTLC